MTDSYQYNREEFLNAAKASGALVTEYPHALTGPEGEALATDVAVLGSDKAQKTVVVTSGLHGVELPFGSHMQRQWLTNAQEVLRSDPALRLVFVHGLNPYATAYGRRTDEGNVDPNRNFVNFDTLRDSNDSYITLAPYLSPRSLNPFVTANAVAHLFACRLMLGRAKFVDTLARGQYCFSDGHFFGGSGSSWTRKTWESIVTKGVITDRLKHVWHMDIHTGEGPRGKLKILAVTRKESPLHRRVEALGSGNVELVSDTFADVTGSLDESWNSFLLPDDCVVTPFAIEIGTTRTRIQGYDVLRAMIDRTTLSVRHNDNHRRAARIIQTMRDVFYPKDKAWLAAATRQSQGVWQNMIQQAAAASP